MLPSAPKDFPTFYLIRHGLTVSNVEGIVAGRTESPLTSKGMDQARRAGEFVRSELSIQTVYCSPIGRTMQTAQLMNLEVIEQPNLQEIHFGKFEGQPFDVWESSGIALKGLFAQPNMPIPQGESCFDVLMRMKAFMAQLLEKANKSVLCISHGGLIKCVLLWLYGSAASSGDPESSSTRTIQNCEILELSVDGFKTVFVPPEL